MTAYLFLPPLHPRHLLLLSNWAFNQTICTEEPKARSSSRRNEFSALSLIAKRFAPVRETAVYERRVRRMQFWATSQGEAVLSVSVPLFVKPWLWKANSPLFSTLFSPFLVLGLEAQGLAMLGECSAAERSPNSRFLLLKSDWVDWKTTQSVKCLLHKQEDSSVDSQDSGKGLGRQCPEDP